MNIEWLDITPEEIERTRMKAYLSFHELETLPNHPSDIEYYYLNSKGNPVPCHVILTRDNGQVIVINKNRCRVMLDKSEIFLKEN